MMDEPHEFDQDWDLSEGLDPDGPSAMDLDRFGSELDSCPHCSELIYDQAQICPSCGWFLEEPSKTLSGWVIVALCGMIVLLIVVLS
ncbi:MAG: zinc ribbon domain-containing protein [Phycisphaerales bacterium]|jgi:hypothetical protein|nr:zinc ribbon domain-containing protein [Phycisphaerales bacterium]